jgi:uracil-DNA glycosylase
VPALDPATQQALAARLRFYRDLGLTDLYRRAVDPALLETLMNAGASLTNAGAPGSSHLGIRETDSQSTISGAPSNPAVSSPDWVGNHEPQQEQAIPPRKPIATPPAVSDAIPASDRAAALRVLQEEIGDCTRCALHVGRNKLVFGDGDPNARLMFVGEGPGADEDAQGLPFVGKAGQLLNNMIGAMGLKREEVYIANVVKCRPPGNRTPEPDEANTCSQFLFRQIDIIRPEVIVALGATAATYLLGQRQPLAGLRGRVHSWRGSKLIVTYHPAFLLRDPRQKKEAWADLQIAMRELGLEVKSK